MAEPEPDRNGVIGRQGQVNAGCAGGERETGLHHVHDEVLVRGVVLKRVEAVAVAEVEGAVSEAEGDDGAGSDKRDRDYTFVDYYVVEAVEL